MCLYMFLCMCVFMCLVFVWGQCRQSSLGGRNEAYQTRFWRWICRPKSSPNLTFRNVILCATDVIPMGKLTLCNLRIMCIVYSNCPHMGGVFYVRARMRR